MHPLDCDLLVVDETSMVDVPLMRGAAEGPARSGAALLLVGDVDQLPSVGPGQVLADIIASGAVPVVRLTEVFRQAAESRIVTNAHRINRGEMPDLKPPTEAARTSTSSRRPTRRTGLDKLLAVVRDRIPRRFGLDPVRDVQVLCPMNRGGLGARSLNIELQAALNPPGEAAGRAVRLDLLARATRSCRSANDYDKEVYNGDLGIVSPRSTWRTSEVVVDFDGPGGRLRLRRAGRAGRWPTRPRSTRARARSTRRW